jgi:response regulator RpfG family c-di-GMP phosphodiesterase
MDSEILFNKKIKLLYIDDEENNLHALKATFRREFDVDIAISTAEARPLLEEHSYEVIISDQRMPDQTGVEFFQEIKFTHPDPVRILLTGYADITAVVDAINMGEIYRYLQKPWNELELSASIYAASELFRLRASNIELTEKYKRVNKQMEFLVRQSMIS